MIFYVMVSVPQLNTNSSLYKFEMVYKDCFMLSVHISSYGCTQKVFQEQERNVTVKAQLRATLTNFLSANKFKIFNLNVHRKSQSTQF